METIHTIEDLLIQLNIAGKDRARLMTIFRAVRLTKESLSAYLMWNKERIMRNCISRTRDYELLLICWEPGQYSSVHDYDKHEAWVNVIEGCLEERRFRLDNFDRSLHLVGNNQIATGEISHISGGLDMHQYVNCSDKRAVSLHLYLGSVDKWKVYNTETRSMEEILVPYDSFRGKKVEHFN